MITLCTYGAGTCPKRANGFLKERNKTHEPVMEITLFKMQ